MASQEVRGAGLAFLFFCRPDRICALTNKMDGRRVAGGLKQVGPAIRDGWRTKTSRAPEAGD
jgi:hypothetical protein